MAIEERELKKEKLILKKVSNLLNENINELEKEVHIYQDDLIEFKKLTWSDFSSFDQGDIVQAKSSTIEEENRLLNKQTYLKRLIKIKHKPYFASIIFKDLDGEIFNIYISLTYLKDKHDNNILYDWRSPICSLFYDYETGPCSYLAPAGEIKGELLRKRQYKIENSELLSVFDNSLNINDDILQEVLATESDEKMKNIVNTIQQEQNQIIRNLEDRNLIVQGIAGSGKTSVALHRIAFLLYQIKNLKSNNILIFSPNNIFTEYISNVLPELGENNTLQTTFNDYLSYLIEEYKEVETYTDFIARYYSYLENNESLIKYKQSDVIIHDLDDFIDDFIGNAKIEDDILESKNHLMTMEELNEMLNYRYNRLPLFERLEEMASKLSEIFYQGSQKKKSTFYKLLVQKANFQKDYKKIYKSFFLSKYCRIPVTEVEINSFLKKEKIHYEDSLIFAYIKGRLEGFHYEGNIKQVVVDEAQDYNKLQYIIMANIFKKAEFTILGDIHQNINPYYQYQSLEELTTIFDSDTKYLELLKTYRSSKEITEYTNKILNLNHVNAIRRSSNLPVVFRKGKIDLRQALLKDVQLLQEKYKSIAIITKDSQESKKIYQLLKDDLMISLVEENTVKFHKELIIIPSYLSKGLEFDCVIVYNNRENSYRKNERNLLYVACTRAQHELYVYN
ncbi:MAG: AAA family ATPase [Bacilli bacterium]|nr:AAA family ATPase [Bacilli bacterium]